MFWEELTGDQFPEAVAKSEGVCLLPLSCIERHAHHLPLGTDMYIARDWCQRAAEIEPAVIFPNFIFTQIFEARHCAGTISIDEEIFIKLLDNVCREISRNGMKKIVIVNSHGGNFQLIYYFCQLQLASPRDYVVYVANPALLPEDKEEIDNQWDSATVPDHAGEGETSAIMSIRPDLVRIDQLRSDGEGEPLGRLDSLSKNGVYTGIWWYADFPTHYHGDGVPATAEKGNKAQAARGRAFAKAIRHIKDDKRAAELQEEFYKASQH